MHICVLSSLENMVLDAIFLPNEIEKSINYPDLDNLLLAALIMKALILQNKVIQIEAEEFPVHPDLQWIEIPQGTAVQVGWIYTGSSFIAAPPSVPGTGGAGGSGIGGDINIGGRGGYGIIGGAGGDGIGNGINIGGAGGNSVFPTSQPSASPVPRQTFWKSAGAIIVGAATVIGTLVALAQWLGG